MIGLQIEVPGFEDLLRRVIREEIQAVLDERADAWLSHEEAADYLALSPGHLHNLVGQVPSRKVGGRRKYRRSELDAWVEGDG